MGLGGNQMATMHAATRLTVQDLTVAVKRLSAAELREFTRWLVEWQGHNDFGASDDAALIELTRARLPARDGRRLKQLIARSEAGSLSASERHLYRNLAQQAEQLDGARTAALAELVRRRGKPVRVVMEEIGWQGTPDGP
jgi:hypothetical protein